MFLRPFHQLTFIVVHRHKGKLYSKPVSFCHLQEIHFYLVTAELSLRLFNYRSMVVCGGNGGVAPCVLKLASGQIHTTARFTSGEVASRASGRCGVHKEQCTMT